MATGFVNQIKYLTALRSQFNWRNWLPFLQYNSYLFLVFSTLFSRFMPAFIFTLRDYYAKRQVIRNCPFFVIGFNSWLKKSFSFRINVETISSVSSSKSFLFSVLLNRSSIIFLSFNNSETSNKLTCKDFWHKLSFQASYPYVSVRQNINLYCKYCVKKVVIIISKYFLTGVLRGNYNRRVRSSSKYKQSFPFPHH